MKQAKYLLSTVLTVLLLAGCKGNGNTSSSINPQTSLSEGDIERDENGQIIYNNIQLKMWSVTTGDDAKTQDEIITEFNNTYKGMINVTAEHISRYDMEQLLETTMQFDQENAPDLLFSHGSRSSEYNSKGWLAPVESAIEKAEILIDKDDYVTSLLDSVSVNGYLYGLPQDVHSAMIMVRTDILEKNNLTIPTNYQELVDVCESAISKAKNGQLMIRGENSDGYNATEWRKAPSTDPYYPFPMAYGDMWIHEFLGYTAAIQNGTKLIDENGMPAWNSKEMENGLQLLRDFVMPSSTSTNKNAITKAYNAEYDVGKQPFASGTSIFKLLGPWEYINDVAEFDKMLAKDGGSNNIKTISLSNLFAKDSSKDYASKIKGEGHAFMMMSTVESTTKKCASMIFADWMVNNAGIKWAERGHLPSLKSVEQSEEYRNSDSYKNYISNWGTCDDYVVFPATKYYSTIDSHFKTCVQQAMATQFKDTAIKSIIEEQEQDCVDYIELYA